MILIGLIIGVFKLNFIIKTVGSGTLCFSNRIWQDGGIQTRNRSVHRTACLPLSYAPCIQNENSTGPNIIKLDEEAVKSKTKTCMRWVVTHHCPGYISQILKLNLPNCIYINKVSFHLKETIGKHFFVQCQHAIWKLWWNAISE